MDTAHTTAAPIATRADMLSMSGLELMQAVRDGRFARAPLAALLNFALHEVEAGRAVFRGTPTEQGLNPMGGLHGGWYGAILDSAMGCAVATLTPRGSLHTTLEYKVNIIRALRPGTRVEAVGEADHVGRSTGVSHGELRGLDDGKLYATGSTTCLIMDMRGG